MSLRAESGRGLGFDRGEYQRRDRQRGRSGNGCPTGGTTGQVLTKNSNTNYDTGWGSGGSGSGIVTLVTQAGAPSGACTAPSGSNLALSFDTTAKLLYYCNDSTPTWRQFLDNGPGSGFTSALALSGITSGSAGFTVMMWRGRQSCTCCPPLMARQDKLCKTAARPPAPR